MPPNKTTTEWEKKVNNFIKKYCGEYAPHLLDSDENDGQELRNLLSSAKQEEVQRIIELAEKMKSKDYHSPNLLTRITQGEMEDHLLINDLITTLKDYGK